MKVRIVKDYFASDEVYKIARKNGHTAYMAEGYCPIKFITTIES